MTIQPKQSKFSNSVSIASAQGVRSAAITIKNAAQQLGISLSTAYRFNREEGPLKFILNGRRIFIDRVSFDSYLQDRAKKVTHSETVQLWTAGVHRPDLFRQP
jgi:hypothetical protein